MVKFYKAAYATFLFFCYVVKHTQLWVIFRKNLITYYEKR